MRPIKNEVDKKRCLKCGEAIKTDYDKHVILSTINLERHPDNHAYFHFSCWEKYFADCVVKKMKAEVEMMQKNAVKIFENPQLKAVLSNIQGADVALNMLKMPLSSRTVKNLNPILKEKVKEKVKKSKKNKNGKSK